MSHPISKGVRKDNPEGLLPKPGEYGKDHEGEWYCMTPNGHLATLRAHYVEEHEGGKITVKPSIMVSAPDHTVLWHGYLISGNFNPLQDFK